MQERVFGIETEYAVVYHPARGEDRRPTNLELYQRFEPALVGRLFGLPRAFSLLRSKPGFFLENGASFHYEATPRHFEHGLLEMASPECRDPFALLCHERAKDRLVEQLCRDVNGRLAQEGWRGEVRIGKNNVDSQGHTFGSHESYWVDDPLDPAAKVALFPLWAALWLLTLPVLAWFVLAGVALVGAGSALLLAPSAASALAAVAAGVGRRAPRIAGSLARGAGRLAVLPARVAETMRRNPGGLARRLAWLDLPLRPVIALHSALHNRFHFQRIHRDLTAFLVTRTLFTGAGAVGFDGGPLLRLAQRPPFLRSLARIFTSGDDRPLYESRDVFFRPWSALGARRRLHLLIGDANLCDWALVLRTGVTALVLEAIESGDAVEWPTLVRPLAALRVVSRDPGLAARLPLRDGGDATALEIQRRYLACVQRVLGGRLAAGAGEADARWKARVLAMWEETLGLLERDPDALADRVDWIAKRVLLRREISDPADRRALEREGAERMRGPVPAEPASRRLRELAFRALRVDLRYHELSARGGHRRLVRRGAVRQLADGEAVEQALRHPPGDTRAHGRGRAIREACLLERPGGATWHRVRIGHGTWRFFNDPLEPAATLSLG